MKVAQWAQRRCLPTASIVSEQPRRPDALLAFGPRELLEDGEIIYDLRTRWPDAALLGCTIGGGISARGVDDDEVIVTALSLDSSYVRLAEAPLEGDHQAVGRVVAEALVGPELRAVILIVGGLHADSAALVEGLRAVLPASVVVAGGLAGDGQAFAHTGVITSAGYRERAVVALGLYGAKIRAGVASASGWRPFGVDRIVTRAAGKTVYEIDGSRALDVYARYLGDEAARLPGSGLVYPIALVTDERETIRSLSAIDRETGSLTFFGEVPEGSTIRLMHASNAELVVGATQAGATARERLDAPPELALLFSCVGRKAVLGTATQLELDAVVEALDAGPLVAGFYTYGEIGAPWDGSAFEHHNQTMTVMLLSEVPA